MRSMVEGQVRRCVTSRGQEMRHVSLHHLRWSPSLVRGGILASESSRPHHYISSRNAHPRLHMQWRTRSVPLFFTAF